MEQGSPDPGQVGEAFKAGRVNSASGTSLLSAFDDASSTLEAKLSQAVMYVLKSTAESSDPDEIDGVAEEYCKLMITWEQARLTDMLEDDADKSWPAKTLEAMQLVDNTRSVQAGQSAAGQAPRSRFLPSPDRLQEQHERRVSAKAGARALSPGAKTPQRQQGEGTLHQMIKGCLTNKSSNLSLTEIQGEANSPHSEAVVKSWLGLLQDSGAEDILEGLQSITDKLDKNKMKYPTALRHILLAVGDDVMDGGDDDLIRQMIDVDQVVERWVNGKTDGMARSLLIKGAELLSPEAGDTNKSFSSTRRNW
jgi:hypothetical protein